MENGDVGVVMPKSENPIRDAPKDEEPRMDVDEFVIKDNVRIDYNRPPSFLASIKEYGVRDPIKIKRSKEVIDGHVRIHWCKIAIKQLIQEGNTEKATEIRKLRYYFDDEKVDKRTSQWIHGTFGKNLNPVEEGQSYKLHIEEKKISTETLAKRLCRPVNYVEKRLIIAELSEEIQKALIDEKIQLGHALALARLSSEKEMNSKLKRIIDDKLSVAGAIDILKNYNTNLKEADFDKSECKTCKFNGSTQGQIFETGTTLNGNCLNEKCYLKKAREHIDKLKKDYKEKGVRILTEKEFENLRQREYFSSYNQPANNQYKKKCLNGCEKYAVHFGREYGDRIKVQEVCLNPRCFRGVTASDEDPKEREKRLLIQAKDRLQRKVLEFKQDFLIDKAATMIKPSTKETKAFVLHTLLSKYDSYNPDEDTKKIFKEVGIEEFYGNEVFSKIMKLDEKKIDELTAKISALHLSEIPLYELDSASASFGVDLNKHFVITEDFLKPYRKQQLINLAKEIGLHNFLIEKGKADWVNGKRPELINAFFKEGFDLKGKVPKVMIKDE